MEIDSLSLGSYMHCHNLEELNGCHDVAATERLLPNAQTGRIAHALSGTPQPILFYLRACQ